MPDKKKTTVPAEWSGMKIYVLKAKKCVPGKYAERKWNLLKSGATVESYLALEATHAMDKKNWGKSELQHYLDKGYIEITKPKAKKPVLTEGYADAAKKESSPKNDAVTKKLQDRGKDTDAEERTAAAVA